MPVQPADFEALAAIARRYVLTRDQVHRICFDPKTNQRSTRKRLLRLRNAGYLNKHAVSVALPETNGAAPVYYPTKPGCQALASYFDDERFAACITRTPRADRLAHWIAINNTRIVIEQAIAQQDEAQLEGWITEYEVINKDAAKPNQFVLQTQLGVDPPLSCSPDAAFLLSVRGVKKVFYLEEDRATSSPHQIAARKSKGYATLAERQIHKTHFPDTTTDRFSILLVTTSDYRCKETAKAMKQQQRNDLWLYINNKKLTPESFLHEPIVMNHDGEVGPLLKPIRSANS